MKHIVSKRLCKLPADLPSGDEPVFYTTLLAGWAGLFVHCGLLAMFVWQQVDIMIAVNLISVPVWCIYILLTYRNKISAAIYLACFEIMIHAVFVVAILGTQYGFQFYLITIACLLIIKPGKEEKFAWFLSISSSLLFVGLHTNYPQQTQTIIFPDFVNTIFSINFLTTTVSIAYAIRLFKRSYDQQHLALERAANYDMLTNLRNRRSLFALLHQKQAEAHGKDKRFCIAISDIDRFKQVNDVYGHHIGDELLVEISNLMTTLISPNDELARWGGEEFLFYLTDVDPQKAQASLENMRNKIEKTVFTSTGIHSTMSFGLVEVQANRKLEESIQLADMLLYKAKDAGRNCIMYESISNKIQAN